MAGISRSCFKLTRLPLLLLLPVSPACAASFDGSSPFTCAALELASCDADGACRSDTPESLNAPRFIRISVADKSLVGQFPNGPDKTTPIQFIAHDDGQMYLGGFDGTLAWHADVDEETGKISLTGTRNASDQQLAIVVLGVCTAD